MSGSNSIEGTFPILDIIVVSPNNLVPAGCNNFFIVSLYVLIPLDDLTT